MAAASGTNVNTILLNNWYVVVFQLAVVWLALVLQERALRMSPNACPTPPPIDRRFVAGSILRIGLLIAGITWSLAMFVEWSDNPPMTATAFTWYHWIFEHQLLSVAAIALAFVPREATTALFRISRGPAGWTLRFPLLIAGLTWCGWVPAQLASLGLGGFINELLGFIGAPGGMGAIPPDSSLGAPLYFHWAAQHMLLAGFALAVALDPRRATAPLLWTVSADRGVSRDRIDEARSGLRLPAWQRAPRPLAFAGAIAPPPSEPDPVSADTWSALTPSASARSRRGGRGT